MSQQRESGKKILVTRSSMPSYEEYIETIKPIWDSAWLTNMGDFHKRLRQELKDYTGISSLMLFVDRHMTLEMAIQALSLTDGVIATPFTFTSTTHVIVCNGLTPVFCDINPLDYIMDMEQIESLITDKTPAIIPVRVHGNICDMKYIGAIAKKHGLEVIYDTAHTFGERYKGESVARFRDASIFSFHATKVFSTIEGGAVPFAEEWIDHRLNCLKNYGIMDQGRVVWVSDNTKMSEFQAVVGLCNLRRLDDEVEKRRMVTERYHKDLGGVPGLKFPAYKEGLAPSYAYFPIVSDGFRADRNEVYDRLAEHNIFPRRYFYPLTSRFQCYSDRFSPEDTPVVAYMADRVLTLPLYASLSLEQVDGICGATKNI